MKVAGFISNQPIELEILCYEPHVDTPLETEEDITTLFNYLEKHPGVSSYVFKLNSRFVAFKYAKGAWENMKDREILSA